MRYVARLVTLALAVSATAASLQAMCPCETQPCAQESLSAAAASEPGVAGDLEGTMSTPVGESTADIVFCEDCLESGDLVAAYVLALLLFFAIQGVRLLLPRHPSLVLLHAGSQKWDEVGDQSKRADFSNRACSEGMLLSRSEPLSI